MEKILETLNELNGYIEEVEVDDMVEGVVYQLIGIYRDIENYGAPHMVLKDICSLAEPFSVRIGYHYGETYLYSTLTDVINQHGPGYINVELVTLKKKSALPVWKFTKATETAAATAQGKDECQVVVE